MPAMEPWVLPVLLGVVFPVVLVGMFALISSIVSATGWSTIAAV